MGIGQFWKDRYSSLAVLKSYLLPKIRRRCIVVDFVFSVDDKSLVLVYHLCHDRCDGRQDGVWEEAGFYYSFSDETREILLNPLHFALFLSYFLCRDNCWQIHWNFGSLVLLSRAKKEKAGASDY